MPSIQLETGSITYEDLGEGRPVLFVHGYLMGRELWKDVAERLAAHGLRAIAPTWPLGAHRSPLSDSSTAGIHGQAERVVEFIRALGLDDVLLVGNDSGGAICQLVLTEHAPPEVSAAVLTNCDAFDNCPPAPFTILRPMARSPRALGAVLGLMRFGPLRRGPLGFGLLNCGAVDERAQRWAEPVREVPGVLADVAAFTRSLRAEVTEKAATRLAELELPVLIAWAEDDRLFPMDHAVRLGELIAGARLERIPASRCLSMVDQPDTLAGLILDFAQETGDHITVEPYISPSGSAISSRRSPSGPEK